MEKYNSSNQEIKYKESTKKDVPILPKQENKTTIGIRQTIVAPIPIIPPRNLGFAAVIDQPLLPPSFFTYPGQQCYSSTIIEVPPSNLPRHLQFYAVKGGRNIFSREYYEKMKNYFQPRFHFFIDNYSGADDDLIRLPPYHGCGLKNRYGTKKLRDYRNGKQCLFPLWSDEDKKLTIAVTDHLPDTFLLVVRTEFFLKIKAILFLIILLINTTTC